MAKRQIQYATITTAVSIRFDGANVARVIAERDIWLSDGFVFRLLFVGIVARFFANVFDDLATTYQYIFGLVRFAPLWMKLYFRVRLLLCVVK